MNANRFDEFVQLLTQLPTEVWQATVLEEPEWKWMLPLSKVWQFGHFAALFMVLGLNDYQTKGKADVGYWPKVVPLICQGFDPKDPLQLIDVLEPFFIRERFGQNKTKRLKRFIESDLCRQIWVSSAATLATDFESIWISLSRTMKQKPTADKIAFAMKCLALALLMVGETKFDFDAVIAGGSRLHTLSDKFGFLYEDEATECERWRKVLDRIRKSHPDITMIHLDSLLWQIGTSSPPEIKSHLEKLGASNLASRICQLFYVIETSNSHSYTHR